MKLIDELKRDEGLRLTSYRCTKGKLTWGYGRNLDDVGINKSEVEKLVKGTMTEETPSDFKIKGDAAARLLDKYGSKQYAEYLLENDILQTHTELENALSFFNKLDENRQDVLINMCFNLGLTRFLKFRKTLAAVEKQDFKEAARQMLNSKWSQQVKNRAVRLAKIMETGEELCS